MQPETSLCLGCMRPRGDEAACPHCGYPAGGANPAQFLPVRSLLAERYLIGRVLTTGGGTALYMAFDRQQGVRVHLREFCPDALCERTPNGTVVPRGGCDNVFAEYKEKFLRHTRAVARLREMPCAVPITDMFEQNGTAYCVQEVCEGITLEQRLQQLDGKADWNDLRPLFTKLTDTLSAFHAAGVYHLGISPRSLIIGRDGNIHVTDWFIAEARTVGGEIKPELEAGYAAPEQYGFTASCSAAADVYAVAAVLFHLLTGKTPPDRSVGGRDNGLMLPADIARQLPETVKGALARALRVSEGKRTQTMERFSSELNEAPAVAQLREQAEKEQGLQPEQEPQKPPRSSRGFVAAVIVLICLILLLCAALALVWLWKVPANNGDPSSSQPTATTTTTTRPTADPSVVTYEVESVVGQNAYEMLERVLRGNMRVKILAKQFSDEVPKGSIISQTPAAGEQMPADTVVYITVSLGPDSFALPDVSGWKAEDARAYLEALGLQVSEILLEVSDVPKGLVQETNPAPSTVMHEGDTVFLRVSNVEQSAE